MALGVYFYLAFFRLRFAFELEWLESLVLNHVRRVAAGVPIYVRPSLDFVPTFYPPLYYWISAAFCRVFGCGYFPLRLVSVLASVGSFAAIFALVRRETGRAVWGLVAAGLFAATYRACGAWLDLARVDSLFLFFLLLAVVMIRFAETPRSGVAAGLLAAAAFFTKQSALTTIAPLLLWAVVFRRRRAMPLVASFAVAVGLGVLVLDHASSGWFWRFCFTYPSQQPLRPEKLGLFFVELVVRRLPVVAALAAFLLVKLLRGGPFNARPWFYLLALVGATASSLAAYLWTGGADNSFLQVVALLAIVGTIAAADVSPAGAKLAVQRWWSAALCLALVAQFAVLRYDPSKLRPAAAVTVVGERYVASVRSFAGEVFVPCNSALAVAAGKRPFVEDGAIRNLFDTRDDAAKLAVATEMAQALTSGRFDAVFLTDFEVPSMARLLDPKYQLTRVENLGEQHFGFFPNRLYVRKDLLPAP